MSDQLPPQPTSPAAAAAAATTRLQKLRNTTRPRLPISRPPAPPSGLRQARLSLPLDGLFSVGARRRRLLRGGDRPTAEAVDSDDDWSSDSGSAHTPPSATRSAVGSDSSGSDTVGAVVHRARSTRLARGVGLRVVSSPGPLRRRFPSVASSFGLSPIRQHAPTPVSSPVRGRIPSFSPFGGRTRLTSGASAGLAMTPAAAHATPSPEPNFSPPPAVNDEADSSFFSEQDTISFIYEPAVISDAFSKGPAAPLGPASTSLAPAGLSPFATPFVFSRAECEAPVQSTSSRSRLPADKAVSYAALGVVAAVENAAIERQRSRIETIKRLQSSGAGGEPIPVMVGPESLPYARNPSGVDGSVLDNAGRLNVWMRSAEDPEPEHVDYLHFQRRPGALNPAVRVLANDDLLDSAYSRPSDYAVPCAGPRPVFKVARPRQAEVVASDGAASPFHLAPSPLPSHYPSPSPSAQTSYPSANRAEKALTAGWLGPPSALYGLSPSQEEIALQILFEKLQASNPRFHQPFGRPTVDGAWSPDLALLTPSASAFSSSPPSSMGFTDSPFSSLPSHQISPVQHLLPGVYSSDGGTRVLHDSQSSAVLPTQHEIDDAVFRLRLAGYARPFHDPSFGHPNLPAPWSVPSQVGPLPQSASPTAPPGLQSAPYLGAASRATSAATGLMPSAEISTRTGTPRLVGRQDDDLISSADEDSQLYPPSSTSTLVVEPLGLSDRRSVAPGSSSLALSERCDEAIFLPAGVGKGFADGGARRPGPRVKAAPRSLGRRALDSMDVAAGRERQSSILEKERLAVLASCEPEIFPSPAPVVVGDLRVRIASEEYTAAGSHTAQDRPRTTARLKRSTRTSLPTAAVSSNAKLKAAADDVLNVGSLTAMFCDNATPSPSAVAALRRSEQRRVVSDPVRRLQPKPSLSSADTAPSTQRSSHRSQEPSFSTLAAKQTTSATTSTGMAPDARSPSRSSTARGKRHRGARTRAAHSSKSTGRSA